MNSGSVSLITAATAAHFFDFPRFCDEVDRALTPGGYLAVSSLFKDIQIHHTNSYIENQANECIIKFVSIASLIPLL